MLSIPKQGKNIYGAWTGWRLAAEKLKGFRLAIMQFLVTIRRGSPAHAIGRARNLSKTMLEGVKFTFDGRSGLYVSQLLNDLSEAVRTHPQLHIACFAVAPPEPFKGASEAPLQAEDPQPPATTPKKPAPPKKAP